MTRDKNPQLLVLLSLVSFLSSPLALAAKSSPEWDSNISGGRQALTKGDFADADRLLKAALDNTRFFKDGDPRMGVTLRSMGDLSLRQQNWSLAKEYFERALAFEQKLLGPESLEAGDDLYGLALASQQLGDHLAAEIFLKRVEEIWRKKLGLNNPRLLSILPAMGAYASMKNDFASAENYYKQTIPIAEARYGASSPKVGSYLNLLAIVQGNEGKFAEAKGNASRAVDLLKNDPQASIVMDAAQENLRIVERKTSGEVIPGGTAVASAPSATSTAPATGISDKPNAATTVPSVERTPVVQDKPPVKVVAKEPAKEPPSTVVAKVPVNETPVAKVPVNVTPPVTPVVKVPVNEAPVVTPVAKVPPVKEPPVTAVALPKDKSPLATSTSATAQTSSTTSDRVPVQDTQTDVGGKKPWTTDKPIQKADGSDKSQNWGKVRYLADGKLISADQYKALLLASEAYEMMQQEKYRMAADILRKAVEMYPALPAAHTNLGLALSRLGQNDEAAEHLKQSIALDPNRSAPWVNLAGCLQNSGKLKDCVETYNEYLRRFPTDSLAYKAKDLVKHLQEELSEQQDVERQVASASGGGATADYFPYTTHDGVIKWTASQMPLKVFVSSGAKVPGYKPEFEGLFTDAFKQWTTASGDQVKVDFVSKAENSNIECVWTNDYKMVNSPAEGGEAQVSWTKDGIQHVKIVILTTDPTPDSPLSQNQVRAVCMHEIGHSLGLMGHSPRPDDIMYCTMPSAEVKPAISSRDASTLKHLYAPDVVIALKPGLAGGVKSSTDKDSIMNQGVDLMQSRAYAQAMEKFEEVLKLDPGYDTARENLAKVCTNYAVEQADKGNTKEAESLFQKALNAQSKLRNLAVKMTTFENYAKFLRRLRRDKDAERVELEAKSLKGS